MNHINRQDVIQQIKLLIYTRLSKYKLKEQHTILIKCMEFSGYFISQENLKYDDFTEVEYSVIKNKGQLQLQEQELLPGIDSIKSSSIIQGTSIQKEPKFSRLNVLHNYGITSDEMLSQQLNELFEAVLNNLKYSETEQIKQYSIKMYFDILSLYRETNLLKGELKASIKRGYTVLVLYYALLHFQICVRKEQLVLYFNKSANVSEEFSISDLALADKNIKSNFELPDENEICLCNMKSLFDKVQINFLKSEIARLKENGTFHTPVQNVQIAALIHHVTHQPIKIISKFSGVSADTISKAIKQIKFS